VIECVLVTGGAGFIGSALSQHLVSDGLPVVAIDSFLEQVHPQGKRSEFLHPDVTVVRDDVRDPKTWSRFLASYRPIKVVHLAAETGTSQSLTEATRHATVNVVGTTQMLDAFAQVKLLPERIILASSRAVYGEGMWRDKASNRTFYPSTRTNHMLTRAEWNPRYADNSPAQPVPQDAAVVMPQPTSIYGATKLTQEHVLASWCGAFDVPLSILRLQNVYGEGQSPFNSYTGIINIFHRIAKAKQEIPVYEDGEIWRDFIHVDDVVTVIAAVNHTLDRVNHKIDVGTGTVTTIYEAARIIADLHGAPPPFICGKFRNGDVRAAVANVEAMSEKLGIKAKVDFAEGSRRVADWLQSRGYI
jgi:dTDP-L-rhamnose 4-epimerase